MVSLLGALAPFATAGDLLERINGLHFTPETVRSRTEVAGRELNRRHGHGDAVIPREMPEWDFELPEKGGLRFTGSVCYLGLDAFAVPTRSPGGVDWKMLYVGLIYDPPKEHTLYLADYDFERLAGTMRAYAIELGVGEAGTLVALTDGGSGLERVLRQGVGGRAEFVLDWWHLSEKLHELGRLFDEPNAGTARAWVEDQLGTLGEHGGGMLVERWERDGPPWWMNAAGRSRWAEVLAHVRANVHRTDYPTYRAEGWDVGSGPTEAGCKLLGGRLKGTGMRWHKSASAEVAALRALYASGMGLWDAFWQQRTRCKQTTT